MKSISCTRGGLIKKTGNDRERRIREKDYGRKGAVWWGGGAWPRGKNNIILHCAITKSTRWYKSGLGLVSSLDRGWRDGLRERNRKLELREVSSKVMAKEEWKEFSKGYVIPLSLSPLPPPPHRWNNDNLIIWGRKFRREREKQMNPLQFHKDRMEKAKLKYFHKYE